MADEITVGDRLTRTLARSRGLSTGPVGTGHLLYSLAHDNAAAALLDAFDVTPIVVFTVLKTAGRPVGEPDAGALPDPDAPAAERPSHDGAAATGTDGRVVPLSAAAAAAVRSVTDDSRVTLLAALLEDPGSEACAVLRDSGADVDAVRRAAQTGEAERGADRLPPELRPARDALLGRVRYRGRGIRDRLLFSVFARGVNHAAHPVMWARAEADERARGEKRATRTDDLLLAMLVTHAVASAYPHLAVPGAGNYGGGETLLARGIDHGRVRGAALDDRPDEVPADEILRPGPEWPENTSVLLERLGAPPGNRSARILAALA
ncbi:Clp protease N-terminal domain-containing protein [Cryptosporangium sp. NPDC051539]|uniref:Clp protease N-terminal domain-containing protein n=1 Tax=Cryptosporangium sp. NPDC051539 TaxID=3363962 RepID=UPI0037B5EA5C